MEAFWVSGIRPPELDSDLSWLELSTAVISKTFHLRPGREGTLAAEEAFSLGSCCYWYILRADDLYGHVVFLWRQRGPSNWSEDDGGACPFDIGGFWAGRIATNEPLDDVQKKVVVQRETMTIDKWETSFQRYTLANYGSVAEYIRGLPPRIGVPEIVRDLPNHPKAWTWETHIRRQKYAGQLEISRLFMQEQDRDKLRVYLESGNVDEDLAVAVETVITDAAVTDLGTSPASDALSFLVAAQTEV